MEQVGEPIHMQRVWIGDDIRSTKGTAGGAEAWRWLHRRLQEVQAWKGALPSGFPSWHKRTRMIEMKLNDFGKCKAISESVVAAVTACRRDESSF